MVYEMKWGDRAHLIYEMRWGDRALLWFVWTQSRQKKKKNSWKITKILNKDIFSTHCYTLHCSSGTGGRSNKKIALELGRALRICLMFPRPSCFWSSCKPEKKQGQINSSISLVSLGDGKWLTQVYTLNGEWRWLWWLSCLLLVLLVWWASLITVLFSWRPCLRKISPSFMIPANLPHCTMHKLSLIQVPELAHNVWLPRHSMWLHLTASTSVLPQPEMTSQHHHVPGLSRTSPHLQHPAHSSLPFSWTHL